jgi:hypothetical protein
MSLVAAVSACEPDGAEPDSRSGRRIAGGEGAELLPLDSVRLGESDSAYLGSPNYFVVDGRGNFFVSDGMNSHVLQFARDGKLVRTYGRRGKGPGEMLSPYAVGIVGDSALVASDWAGQRLSAYDVRTGGFRGSVPHQGIGFAMQVVNDTVWISSVNGTLKTSLAVWTPGADSVRYRGPLPIEYGESVQLMDVHPYATLAHLGDRVLVGFTGHPDLFLLRRDGSVADTIAVPVARRRGVPDDMVKRFSKPVSREEAAAMLSGLMALHRLPSGEAAVMYLDLTVDGELITGNGYLSVLGADLAAACVDLPLEFSQDGRPTVAFRGDTLFVLEQRLASNTSAVTQIKWYRVNTAACQWVPLNERTTFRGSTPARR